MILKHAIHMLTMGITLKIFAVTLVQPGRNLVGRISLGPKNQECGGWSMEGGVWRVEGEKEVGWSQNIKRA